MTPEQLAAVEELKTTILTDAAVHFEIAKAIQMYVKMLEHMLVRPKEKRGRVLADEVEAGFYENTVTYGEIVDVCDADCLPTLIFAHKLRLLVSSALPDPCRAYYVKRPSELVLGQLGAPIVDYSELTPIRLLQAVSTPQQVWPPKPWPPLST